MAAPKDEPIDDFIIGNYAQLLFICIYLKMTAVLCN